MSNYGCSDVLYFLRILNLREGSLCAVSHNYSRLADSTFGLGLSELWGQRKLYSGIRKNSFQRRLAMTDTSEQVPRDSM